MRNIQFLIAAVLPTLAVLVGILLNNLRLNDLSAQFNNRINDLNKRIDDLNKRFDELRAEMIGRIDGLRDTLRAEIRAEMAQMRAEMAQNHAEVMTRLNELESRVNQLERAA